MDDDGSPCAGCVRESLLSPVVPAYPPIDKPNPPTRPCSCFRKGSAQTLGCHAGPRPSPHSLEYGLNLGAVDFISKPISPQIVLARLRTHLQNREYQKILEDKAGWLEIEVQKKLTRINHLQEASIMVMISLAEFRDECTGWHIKRTQEFVKTLALELLKTPRLTSVLTSDYMEKLFKSAPLHDIGKIAIPDHVLLKPGKLTTEEFEVMKSHAEKGAKMLKQAQQYTSDNDGFLQVAVEIAHSHHEKWDGSGYPEKLSGEAIPLAARIMAVADVYDALTTARPYKSAFSHHEANEIILSGSGSHFDPIVVATFVKCQPRFVEIASTWIDTPLQTK